MKLRIGLLVDAIEVPAWSYALIERIVKSDFAEIDILILNGADKIQRNRINSLYQTPSYFLYNLYRKLDKKLYKALPDAFAVTDAASLLAGIPILTMIPKQSLACDEFEAGDIEEIKARNLDVIVRLGFGVLKGEILHASKFGVWSFLHSDCEVMRGGPPGFWEVFLRVPVTGTTLQVLVDESDKGVVLGKVISSTDVLSVNRNKNNYYWAGLDLLTRKLNQLRDLGADRFFENVKTLNADIKFSEKVNRFPKNFEMATHLPRHVLKLIILKIRKFFIMDQWILLFDISNNSNDRFAEYKKIFPPKNRVKIWADPFVISKDNHYYIYFEEMEHGKKGHISLLVLDENGRYGNPVKVLEKPYHMSYPFIVEWESDYYMIPESAENKSIDVYKCTRFPDEWAYHSTLMDGVRAADTTLFFHQEKWWLFTNMQEYEGASNCSELYLFHSDTPFGNKWVPHPLNPIVSDVRRARPAGGIFTENGEIFRPSQDCSMRYGYAMRISKILKLDENDYQEVEVEYIQPDWSPNIKATHTINRKNRITLIDGVYTRAMGIRQWIVASIPSIYALRCIPPEYIRHLRRMVVGLSSWFH